MGRSSRHGITFCAALALVLGACGAASDAETVPPSTSHDPSTTKAAPPPHFEVIRDVVYHYADDYFDREGLADVVVPTGSGPWPVVVALHGDPGAVGKSWMLGTAQSIAEQGRVVFVPEWGGAATSWVAESSVKEELDAYVQQVRCAVAFARDRAAGYGGDPEHITVYGYSAGGNLALMAGFADSPPLESCVATGPAAVPQAIVSGDGDVLAGASVWDRAFVADPDAFYSITPWRHVDGSHPFRVHIAAVEEILSPYQRSLGDDPAASPVATRHGDIDLIGSLRQMGLIDDGVFDNLDANRWAYATLLDVGYDVHWVLLEDSDHLTLSSEARALLVDTVVNAEG